MTERFDIRSLPVPLIQAPMAGGPSTPMLAAAVSNAGALGFLAAGYLTAERLISDIRATRALTDAPFGVNIFVPGPSAAVASEIEAYRTRLASQIDGVEPGEAHQDDDGWVQKVDAVEKLRPATVTFTFGVPPLAVVEQLHRSGVSVGVTVTTLAEAGIAALANADFLVAQGPEAGGHRGTFDPSAPPSDLPLPQLVTQIRESLDIPIVAAGGVGLVGDVRDLLDVGAVAVQAGTAFLRTDEAWTKPAHSAALADPEFTRTVVTAAFSGRYARGLENDFIRRNDPVAPLGYPEVNQLTAPIRAAAAAAGDSQNLNLWAGTGYRHARTAPAADIVAALYPSGDRVFDLQRHAQSIRRG